MRVDSLLVEKGLAPSRARAQDLIARGRVFILQGEQKTQVMKSSLNLGEHQTLIVEPDPEADRFVSRGGVKMRGALERTKISVRGLSVLDVGISTGGFTDCLLQAGATHAVGLDVGHGQLHEKLRHDPRIRLLEGVNARDLSGFDLVQLNQGRPFDLIVFDVSFISLTLVLPPALPFLRDSGAILALVKPQFEVGWKNLGKGGIVKRTSLFAEVEVKIRRACEGAGLVVEDYFESSIEGADGNREFFIHAVQPQLRLDSFSLDGLPRP